MAGIKRIVSFSRPGRASPSTKGTGTGRVASRYTFSAPLAMEYRGTCVAPIPRVEVVKYTNKNFPHCWRLFNSVPEHSSRTCWYGSGRFVSGRGGSSLDRAGPILRELARAVLYKRVPEDNGYIRKFGTRSMRVTMSHELHYVTVPGSGRPRRRRTAGGNESR